VQKRRRQAKKDIIEPLLEEISQPTSSRTEQEGNDEDGDETESSNDGVNSQSSCSDQLSDGPPTCLNSPGPKGFVLPSWPSEQASRLDDREQAALRDMQEREKRASVRPAAYSRTSSPREIPLDYQIRRSAMPVEERARERTQPAFSRATTMPPPPRRKDSSAPSSKLRHGETMQKREQRISQAYDTPTTTTNTSHFRSTKPSSLSGCTLGRDGKVRDFDGLIIGELEHGNANEMLRNRVVYCDHRGYFIDPSGRTHGKAKRIGEDRGCFPTTMLSGRRVQHDGTIHDKLGEKIIGVLVEGHPEEIASVSHRCDKRDDVFSSGGNILGKVFTVAFSGRAQDYSSDRGYDSCTAFQIPFTQYTDTRLRIQKIKKSTFAETTKSTSIR
jgi:hypothetical protein